MNKLFYPALFHKTECGGFWVSFPDIPECLTEGDNMTQAYEMAVDALGLALTSRESEGQEIPNASVPDKIVVSPESFLVIVEFDIQEYKRRNCSKAVKKTLSIPEWMNDEACRLNINFSQVLQDALMQILGKNDVMTNNLKKF
jgi:predicted RNase H-like HicB family nuclease